MEWFNLFGLMIIAAIMVPNIVFALRCKDGFENKGSSKRLELLEQVGRYGCFALMIFNIPGTWFGWWSDEVFAAYLVVNSLLIAFYWGIWILCWRKNGIFRALALSGIPSVIFLFSGVASRSVLLILAALIFAPAHILISYRNAIA